MSQEKRYDLSKIIDEDNLIEFIKIDQYLEVVNLSPPSNWIREHPFAKGVKYLPIDKVEYLLTKIFQEWKVEILREGQLLNSIYVTIRLHYKHPIDGWMWTDGTAAVPIKTRKGEDASNMAAILNDAIQTGLPAAESFAIKDAADKLGAIFGKDINRKDTLGFKPSYGTDENREKIEQKRKALASKLESEKNDNLSH